MDGFLKVSIIIGAVSSLFGLIATCVRQWAYREMAGELEIHGLWIVCLKDTCRPVEPVPAWLYGVRALMIMGTLFISAGTILLLVYKYRRTKLIAVVAIASCTIAGLFFFVAILVYGTKEAELDDFKYMYFYNAFYIPMFLVAMCILVATFASGVVKHNWEMEKYKLFGEVQ